MKVENAASFHDIKKLDTFIDGIEITSFVPQLVIYQDIFLPCWSCIVTIEDSANLIMRLPIRPGSKLSVSVTTQTNSTFDGSKTYEFIIYKLGEKIFKGQQHIQYKLFCASQGFLMNQTKRISKTFSQKKPEDMVSTICSEYLNGSLTSSDPSDNDFHLIVPNWSPFMAGWWCAKMALKEKRSDYIFFMNDFDKYSFRSIEELYTNESSNIKFFQKPAHIRNATGDAEDDFGLMIEKYYTDDYDGMTNLASGFYGSQLQSYNIINKKWETKKFKFGDDISADLESKPWQENFDKTETANISFLPKHAGMHANQTINEQVTNWHTSRKSSLMKLEQNKLLIQVAGGARTWELLGKNCQVDLPSNQDQESNLFFDKYLKGNYLVTHICQVYTSGTVTVNFELVKKRLEEMPTLSSLLSGLSDSFSSVGGSGFNDS